MISYELLVLFRIMPKPELASVVKRTANVLFNNGAILRKLEHLGTRDMPCKTSAHNLVHHKASYFMFEFNIPPPKIETVLDECARDVDIIRRRIFKKKDEKSFDCTLHEDMLPPPYRKSVQEMVAEAQKSEKPRYKYNSGLDYYPFQK